VTGIRLLGITLVAAGAALAYYLGIKGESVKQMRDDLLAFWKLSPAATASAPGAALP
jgi:hypothetical protein